jgi:hypothetical protein
VIGGSQVPDAPLRGTQQTQVAVEGSSQAAREARGCRVIAGGHTDTCGCRVVEGADGDTAS